MRNYEVEIRELKSEMYKDIIDAIGSIFIGIIGVVTESIFRFVTLLWLWNWLEGKSPFYLESTDSFDDAASFIYCANKERKQIKELKKEQKEELKRLAKEQAQKQVQEEVKKEVKHLDNFILEYIRDLLIKCKDLPTKAQLEFITRLKGILTDYMTQYKENLEKNSTEIITFQSMNIDLLNQTTLKKLVVIEDAINSCLKTQSQIDLLNQEEQEVLSVIDITDEMNEQTKTLKV